MDTIVVPESINKEGAMRYTESNNIKIDPTTLTEDLSFDIIYTTEQIAYAIHHMLATEAGEYTKEYKTEEGHAAPGRMVIPNQLEIPGYTFANKTSGIVTKDQHDFYVNYNWMTYNITYNTDGGSYVAEQLQIPHNTKATIWNKGKNVCGKTEHVHTALPAVEATEELYSSGILVGCYKVTRSGRGDKWSPYVYSWVLSCGFSQTHTHTEECYTGRSPVTKKVGYSFAGWYLDKDCTQEAPEVVEHMTEDIIVYAKWVPVVVDYSVVTFIEKYDNDSKSTYYNFQASTSASGVVGTTVTASGKASFTDSGYYEKTPTYSSAVVKAEGTTVVGVYYRLKRYSLTFDLNDKDYYITFDGGQTKYYGSSYVIKDVVLGQDISAYWPSSENIITNDRYQYSSWNGSWATKRFEATTEILSTSSTNLTFKASYTSSSDQMYVRYWLEKWDGSGDYAIESRYCQYLVKDTSLSGKDLYGFEYSYREGGNKTITEPVSFTGYVRDFYYTRNTHKVTYNYKSKTLKTNNKVYYGTPFSEIFYTPTVAETGDASLPADAKFLGWFDNPSGNGDPIASTRSMPDADTILYAVFGAPERAVDVVLEAAGSSDTKKWTVKYGETLNESIGIPEKEGFVFLRWYTLKDGVKVTFDPNQPILEDTVIYAAFLPLYAQYTVQYLDEYGAQLLPDKLVYDETNTHGSMYTENYVSIPGYRPDSAQKILTIDVYHPDNMKIVFSYREAKENTKYIVKYVDEKNVSLAPNKEVPINLELERVVEYAIDIAGYHPLKASISHFISGYEENNVITFVYSKYLTLPANIRFFVEGVLSKTVVTTKTFRIGDTVQESEYIAEKIQFEADHPAYALSSLTGKNTTVTEKTEEINIDQYYMPDADYTVVTHLEKLEGGYAEQSEIFDGITGQTVSTTASPITGFSYDSGNNGNILSAVVKSDGTTTLHKYYKRNSYTVTYAYTGDVPSGASKLPSGGTYKYGATVTVAAKSTASGFDFEGWNTSDVTITGTTFTMPAKAVAFTGSFGAAKTTYTVKHYQQNLGSTGYTEMTADEQILEGRTGNQTNAVAKDYVGFTAQSFDQATIAGNGSTVISILYTRNSYDLLVQYTKNGAETKLINAKYQYGQSIIAPTTPSATGYTFSGWSETIPETMPAKALTITGVLKANDDTSYKVEHWLENPNTGVFVRNDSLTQTLAGTADTLTAAEAKELEGYTAKTFSQQTIKGDGTTVVKIEYNCKNITLTFLTDGKKYDSRSGKYGAAVSSVNNPSKTGYTFDGWDDTVPATFPAEDKTFNAKWKINKHTITIKLGNGEEDIVITQDYGTDIEKPEDPEHEGYTFDGWDKTIPTTMPDKDMTINAKWKINKYTITYYVDEVKYGTPDTYEYGAEVDMRKWPTKEDCVFSGWDQNHATMPAKDLKIYGTFSQDYFFVTYVINKGTAPEQKKYQKNSTVTVEADASLVGYTFSGWTTADAEVTSGKFIMPASAVTFNGTLTANDDTPYKVEHYQQDIDAEAGTVKDTYTLVKTDNLTGTTDTDTEAEAKTYPGFTAQSFDQLNISGDGTTVVKVYYNRNTVTLKYYNEDQLHKEIEAPYGSVISAPTDPLKTGYDFTGWDQTAPTIMPAVDTDIHATFEKHTYHIIYDPDNGEEPAEYDLLYEADMPDAGEPTKVGYTFVCWDPAIPETVPANDFSSKAVYTINEHTVKYYVDGKQLGETETYEYGETLQASPTATKTGYTFTQWDQTVPATMPDEDLEFNAEFTINSHKLTITYKNTKGETVFTTVEETLDYDTPYEYISPAKAGYTPNHAKVNGNMVDEPVTVNVVYTPQRRHSLQGQDLLYGGRRHLS